ncbi:hypothetical protein FHR75_004479 [Kineococcus radiotolerans]|uniref:Uncharacterized protein n=1 Tax=Kineococcus radiotolerans TaxID=131568 RepID=A0A7W4TR92_KINRA|nr:hypothetical protein [Kineococcus radiotolerans]
MKREGLGELQQLADDVSAADWIVAAANGRQARAGME